MLIYYIYVNIVVGVKDVGKRRSGVSEVEIECPKCHGTAIMTSYYRGRKRICTTIRCGWCGYYEEWVPLI